jgi:hypothetical protein
MGRFDQTSGLCAACRHCTSHLERYTSAPWDLNYECDGRWHPFAPQARGCHYYEREPGSDDETR